MYVCGCMYVHMCIVCMRVQMRRPVYANICVQDKQVQFVKHEPTYSCVCVKRQTDCSGIQKRSVPW
jgi:hypothetical protein